MNNTQERFHVIPVPADGFLNAFCPWAVLEGYLEGEGRDISFIVTAPEGIEGLQVKYLWFLTRTDAPMFLEVEGPARRLDFKGYEALYRKWWFAQGSITDGPDAIVVLPGRTSVPADEVWRMRRHLLWLRDLDCIMFWGFCHSVHANEDTSYLRGQRMIDGQEITDLHKLIIKMMTVKDEFSRYEVINPWHSQD